MSQIAYIQEHIDTLAKGDKISITKSKLAVAGSNSKKANIAKRVIHVFFDLIRSCTISRLVYTIEQRSCWCASVTLTARSFVVLHCSEQNPFIREGIPITSRQTLLRELNVWR
jgi:ribosomal protein L2